MAMVSCDNDECVATGFFFGRLYRVIEGLHISERAVSICTMMGMIDASSFYHHDITRSAVA